MAMIRLKSPKDIEHLRKAGFILASVLDEVIAKIHPEVDVSELDQFAEKKIREAGCIPAFKNYQIQPSDTPYPTTLCMSVNEEVVHGIALGKTLKNGDIVGVDVGLEYKADGVSYFTDMAKTVAVGDVSQEAKKLIDVTKNALTIALKQISPGKTVADIGSAVEEYVVSNGFSVVRDLVGHGVGFAIHEDPAVPNYYTKASKKIILEEGMVLAVEPMVNMGLGSIRSLPDGWTIVTADKSLSAHFENTIAVTKSGYEVLTSNKELTSGSEYQAGNSK